MTQNAHCTACRGRPSDQHFLYVIGRDDQAWTKIGIARRIGARMSTYRRNGIDPVIYERRTYCCEFAASIVEFAAHEQMDRRHKRMQGDWFEATPENSYAAIERALRTKQVKEIL